MQHSLNIRTIIKLIDHFERFNYTGSEQLEILQSKGYTLEEILYADNVRTRSLKNDTNRADKGMAQK